MLAGQGAYERGSRYFLDGRVLDIATNGQKTVATVSGTRVYSVRLRHTARVLDGACDCPASEGIDFCKHCVAVALAIAERQSAGELSPGRDQRAAIRSFLERQTAEVLTRELMDMLPRVPELRQRLLIKAHAASGDLSLRELKKPITKATRSKHLWDYAEVREYFQTLESTLDNLALVAEDVPPGTFLKAVLYGIERLDRALETVDDSGGYRCGPQQSLLALHIRALARLDWTAERRAAHVLDLALRDPWDLCAEVPHDHAAELGQEFLEAFYAEVESRLAALLAVRPGADFDTGYPHLRLKGYLMERAAEAEDWDRMIELERLTATSARDYERIAALHLRKQDMAGAAEWLEKVDALDEGGRPGKSPLWARVHAANKDWHAAVEVQRDVFERNPDYGEYRRLLEYASSAGLVDQVRDDVALWLQEDRRQPRWQREQCAWTLAQILRDDRDWVGVRDSNVAWINDPGRLLEAARWLADDAPAEAADLYARAIDAFAGKKAKTGYRAAAKVLAEAKPAFDAIGADAFVDYVSRLREEHARKTSFMAILDGAAARLGE